MYHYTNSLAHTHTHTHSGGAGVRIGLRSHRYGLAMLGEEESDITITHTLGCQPRSAQQAEYKRIASPLEAT